VEFDTNFDYLTATMRCPKEWEGAVDAITRLVPNTTKKRPWRFMSYDGYACSSLDGHLAWGKGKYGGIVQAGGRLANHLASKASDWMPAKTRVTRLDLAVTFALEAPRQLVRDLLNVQERGWRFILPEEGEGGGTLYVGSRSSDAFGRLYDKGALLNKELPPSIQVRPAHLWRAEVEYKAGRARAAWDAGQTQTGYENRRKWLADTVLTWFQSRGVALPIMPTSSSIVSVVSRGIDDVRTLTWFYEQVRPALLRLVDNGKKEQALDALGVHGSEVYGEQFRFVGDGQMSFAWFDKAED